MNDLYAALEIGTTRTVLAIGEVKNDGRLTITCHSEIASTGIRKSQILDINQATQSIRAVLQQLEKKQAAEGAKVILGNIFLAVSGQHIKADPFVGTVQVEGSSVSNDDINDVIAAAHSMTLPKDRELLDIIDQDYALDSFGGVSDPRGMSGRVLRLNTLQIHADHDRLQDARKAAEGAHLEITDPLFAASCAADAVLEDYERKNGVIVLDLGGGSTGYSIYSDDYIISAGVIGVGGDHITNDIANAFKTTNAQAESIKTNDGSAIIRPNGTLSDRVKVEQGDIPLMDNRTISRRSLDIVVNARLKELFTVIRDTLEDQGLLRRLHGVVLTGGGARMDGIEQLAEQVLGISARIGKPINVDGLENEEFPAEFAAVAGCLMYAQRNYEDPSLFGDFFKRIFK